MDWLSGWLKAVILVILLATFIDLLLPNHSMQRYVKTVMSLFLLLTLLQPLLSLFQKHGNLEEMLAGALFKEGSPLWSRGNAEQVEPLSAIQQRADTLRSRQEQDARRLVESQAANLMKRKIEQTAGLKVQRVQVETATDDNDQAIIKNVSVTLAPGAPDAVVQGKAKPAAAMEPVKPVAPVTAPDIRIGSGPERNVPVTRMQNGEAASLSPQLEQKKTQITLMLEQDWQLSSDQIAISIEQGR